MTEQVALPMTPRCAALVGEVWRRAEARGEAHFGTEHLLEAAVLADSGVARTILDEVGAREAILDALERYRQRPGVGSVAALAPGGGVARDADGEVIFLAVTWERPGAPATFVRDDGDRLVRVVPAPGGPPTLVPVDETALVLPALGGD